MKVQAATIEWYDSCANAGWQPKNEWRELRGYLLCTSIGFLVRDEKDFFTLAQSHSHFTTFGEFISIPKCCVRRITKLKIWADCDR